MRVFIGIDLPILLKEKIGHYLEPIKESPKGWEDPHDYHLTLLFIGEIPEIEIPPVLRRMEGLSFEPFELLPTGFEFFNRRIMYLAFEKSSPLLHLRNQIEKEFPEFINSHAKEFIPHVTVKRWQRYEFDHLEKGIARQIFFEPFQVSNIQLFKSEKNSLGQKYHVVRDII